MAPRRSAPLAVVEPLQCAGAMRSVLALCALAGAATADPLALREDALRERPVELEAADVKLTWRVDAVGASTGSRTAAANALAHTASVGAEVAVTGPYCDFLAAGGQVDARSGELAPLALQQWASLCPLSGVVRVILDHRLLWDVTPRLLAPPRLRPDGNRRELIGFEFGAWGEKERNPFARVPVPREYAGLMAMRLEIGVGWASDASRTEDISASVDVDVVRYVIERLDGTPPFEARLVSFAFDMVDPTDPADPRWNLVTTMRLDAGRVDGVRVGGGVRLGAALGLGLAGVMWSPDGRMTTSNDVIAGRAALSLERDLGDATVRVAAGRDLWPTWDGRAVFDDRVTASVRATAAGVRGRVEASAARVRLLDADHGLRDTPVGGVAVIAERDLGDHLTARGHVEVGRSVYAAGASFEAPRWAAESVLSLQLHAGNR